MFSIVPTFLHFLPHFLLKFLNESCNKCTSERATTNLNSFALINLRCCVFNNSFDDLAIVCFVLQLPKTKRTIFCWSEELKECVKFNALGLWKVACIPKSSDDTNALRFHNFCRFLCNQPPILLSKEKLQPMRSFFDNWSCLYCFFCRLRRKVRTMI